jgi:hypothetical protein
MDFDKRLAKAVQRGTDKSDRKAAEQQAAALSEEECRRLHTQYRLELAEHIESCIRKLVDHFPGFQYETILGDKGWGSGVSRDDVNLSGGRRGNEYSRMELVVPPVNKYHVLDLAAKGTVRNKELLTSNLFQPLADADAEVFRETIDLWVLEYAELYAAKS